MVVTLLVVFHGLKNDRKNKKTKQCWKDDGIDHGSSMKGYLWSSSAPARAHVPVKGSLHGSLLAGVQCSTTFSATREIVIHPPFGGDKRAQQSLS
jgi:hypothetical protein